MAVRDIALFHWQNWHQHPIMHKVTSIVGRRYLILITGITLVVSACERGVENPSTTTADSGRAQQSEIELCNLGSEHVFDLTKTTRGVQPVDFKPRRDKDLLNNCEMAVQASPDDPKLRYQLGRVLLKHGDTERGYALIREAADEGHSFAVCTIASAYFDGADGHTVDYEQAHEWAKRGYEMGDPSCAVLLGVAYKHPPKGVDLSLRTALSYLREAAAAGHPFGMVRLGEFLGRFNDTPEHFRTAWLEEARRYTDGKKPINLTALLDPGACISLSEHPDDPNKTTAGVPDHEFDAFRASAICGNLLWIDPTNTGARYGFSRAQFDIAGDNGSNEAWDDMKRAAAEGHQHAKYRVAAIYAFAANDPTAAVKMVKEAIEGGVKPATALLGEFYVDGIGVEKSTEEALRLLERAAEEDVERAHVELARIYNLGLGVEADLARGLGHMRRVIEINPHNTNIAVQIGQLLLMNEVPKPNDIEEAIHLFESSSASGSGEAAFLLYELYLEGRHVEKDQETAEYWLGVAHELRHKEAWEIYNDRRYKARQKEEMRRRQAWAQGYAERARTNTLTYAEQLARKLQDSHYGGCNVLGGQLQASLGTSREDAVLARVQKSISKPSFRMCR